MVGDVRPKIEITDEMVDGAYEYLKPYCTGLHTEGHYRERARGVLEAALNGERRKGDRRADSPEERLRRGLTEYEKPPLGTKGAPRGASKDAGQCQACMSAPFKAVEVDSEYRCRVCGKPVMSRCPVIVPVSHAMSLVGEALRNAGDSTDNIYRAMYAQMQKERA